MHPAIFRECVSVLYTLEIGSAEYVAADLSVRTDSREYAVTKILAGVLLGSYVWMLPVFVFGSLFRNRLSLHTEDAQACAPRWVRERFHYFYYAFKPGFFWWEVISFTTKNALVLIAIRASTLPQPGVPLFGATWVVLIACMVEFKFDAYVRNVEGRLVKATQFALLGLMLAAQGLAVAKLEGEMGFQNAARVLAGVGVLVVIVVFAVVFGRQGYLKRRASRLSSSRSMATTLKTVQAAAKFKHGLSHQGEVENSMQGDAGSLPGHSRFSVDNPMTSGQVGNGTVVSGPRASATEDSMAEARL
eukprot:g787.t1